MLSISLGSLLLSLLFYFLLLLVLFICWFVCFPDMYDMFDSNFDVTVHLTQPYVYHDQPSITDP